MQAARSIPRLARLALTGAVVATPALAGLMAAATPVQATASGPRAVMVVADPGLGPGVGVDPDGIGLGDVTVDPRAVTSGMRDIGISGPGGAIKPVGVVGNVVHEGLTAVESTVGQVAPGALGTPTAR